MARGKRFFSEAGDLQGMFLLFLMQVLFGLPLIAVAEQVDSSSVLNELMQRLPGVVKQLQQHKQAMEDTFNESESGSGNTDKHHAGLVRKQTQQQLNSQRAYRQDPFAITSEMVQQAHLQGRGLRFVPLAGAQVPDLKLRGIVQGADGKRLGLIEVGNEGVFLVRKGETISLHSGGNNTVINIQEISQLSVVVESGTLGEVIIVR